MNLLTRSISRRVGHVKVYLACLVALSSTGCRAQQTPEPAPSANATIQKALQANMGLAGAGKQKTIILLSKGIAIPELNPESEASLRQWLEKTADISYTVKELPGDKWSSLIKSTSTHKIDSSDVSKVKAKPSDAKADGVIEARRFELKEAKELLTKAIQEFDALAPDDNRRPLFQARVDAAKDKLNVFLSANPELREEKGSGSELDTPVVLGNPVAVSGFFPPREQWNDPSAWVGLRFSAKLQVVVEPQKEAKQKADAAKDDENVLPLVEPIVQTLGFEYKQVQVVRPAFSLSQLSNLLAGAPKFNGSLLVTDFIVLKNARVRLQSAEAVEQLLSDISQKKIMEVRVGPIILAGTFPDFLAKHKLSPSSEGDSLTINTTQIVGLVCEKIK